MEGFTGLRGGFVGLKDRVDGLRNNIFGILGIGIEFEEKGTGIIFGEGVGNVIILG